MDSTAAAVISSATTTSICYFTATDLTWALPVSRAALLLASVFSIIVPLVFLFVPLVFLDSTRLSLYEGNGIVSWAVSIL